MKKDRTGEKGVNKLGQKMKIVEYKDNKNLMVFFPCCNEYIKTTYFRFSHGLVYPKNRDAKDSCFNKKFAYATLAAVIAALLLTLIFV